MAELPEELRRWQTQVHFGGAWDLHSFGAGPATSAAPQPSATSSLVAKKDKAEPVRIRHEVPPPIDAEELEMTAYTAWGYNVPIVPAWKRREWMDAIGNGFPYHCLPMALSNVSGWFMLAGHDAEAEWNGGTEPSDITVKIIGDAPQVHFMSAVGNGIVTWTVPFIFRTSPGWNLLCRGPANYWKDGLAPLEGIIETDWTNASFSMNYQFTRPGKVSFKKGEPVAMFVPHRRHDLEPFTPRFAEMSSNPELHAGYTLWINERQEFQAAQKRGDAEAIKRRFQKHYFVGESNTGDVFEPHQKIRSLKKFTLPPEAERSKPAAGGPMNPYMADDKADGTGAK